MTVVLFALAYLMLLGGYVVVAIAEEWIDDEGLDRWIGRIYLAALVLVVLALLTTCSTETL